MVNMIEGNIPLINNEICFIVKERENNSKYERMLLRYLFTYKEYCVILNNTFCRKNKNKTRFAKFAKLNSKACTRCIDNILDNILLDSGYHSLSYSWESMRLNQNCTEYLVIIKVIKVINKSF